jgi:LPS O-antigen subunit length determinant protein (WzzB/FepE family)
MLAALFGALVALFKLVGNRWMSIQMIAPVTAAFAVAATTTFLLADQGWADTDLRAMIARS